MMGQGHNGGYERRDAQMKYINAIQIGVAVLTLLGLGVTWGFVRMMDREREASVAPVSPLAGTLPQQPPEPRLQVTPARDYREYRAAQDAVLTSYEIIDAQAGVVRIPIERAMDLIAERGLPVRGEPSEVSPEEEKPGAEKQSAPRGAEKRK
jgi:hypothetical protein